MKYLRMMFMAAAVAFSPMAALAFPEDGNEFVDEPDAATMMLHNQLVAKAEAYLQANLQNYATYVSGSWTNVIKLADGRYSIGHNYTVRNDKGSVIECTVCFTFDTDKSVISMSQP